MSATPFTAPGGAKTKPADPLFDALKLRKGAVTSDAPSIDKSGWEWSARQKGSARKAAAAEAARQNEEKHATLRLNKLQRKLLATLERFLNTPVTPTHLLIADANEAVREHIVSAVMEAADANLEFGLPRLEIQIALACNTEEVVTALKGGQIHIAFIAGDLTDDYAARLNGSVMPGEVSTIFVSFFCGADLSLFDPHVLYRDFGVQDQIEWPPTPSAMRSVLHKWLPCASIAVPPSPLLSHRSPSSSSPLLYSPAARQPEPGTPLAPRLRHYPGGGGCAAALGCPLRILVVSSCHVSAATLVLYCETFALWADHADSAAAAMKRLEARGQPYDLVVVEPALSGPMSGYALCAWWRERAVSHEVAPTPLQQAVVQADDAAVAARPATVTTVTSTAPITTEFVCLAEEPDREACADCGIQYCFAKPLSVRCFASVLRKWLMLRDTASRP